MEDEFVNEFRKKFSKKTSKEQDETKSTEQKSQSNNNDEQNKENTNNTSPQSVPAAINPPNNQNMEKGRVSHFIKKNIFNKVLKSDTQNEQEKGKNGKSEIIKEKDEKSEGIIEKPKNLEKNQRTVADIVKDENNYFTHSSVPDFGSDNSPKERTSTNKTKIMNHLHSDDNQKFEEIEIPQQARNSTNVRPQIISGGRKSVKDLIEFNEIRCKALKDEEDKKKRRESIRQKNKEEWRIKMQKLAQFIKDEKDEDETDQDFYDDNADYFKDFGITNFKDFMSIRETIDFFEGCNKNNYSMKERKTYTTNPLRKTKMGVINEENDESKVQENQNEIKTEQNPKNLEFTTNQRMTYTPTYRNYNKYNVIELSNDGLKNDVGYYPSKEAKMKKLKIQHSYNNCFLVDKYEIINKQNKHCKENNFVCDKSYKIKKYNNKTLSLTEASSVDINNYIDPKKALREQYTNISLAYNCKKKTPIHTISNNQIDLAINSSEKKKDISLANQGELQYISPLEKKRSNAYINNKNIGIIKKLNQICIESNPQKTAEYINMGISHQTNQLDIYSQPKKPAEFKVMKISSNITQLIIPSQPKKTPKFEKNIVSQQNNGLNISSQPPKKEFSKVNISYEVNKLNYPSLPKKVIEYQAILENWYDIISPKPKKIRFPLNVLEITQNTIKIYYNGKQKSIEYVMVSNETDEFVPPIKKERVKLIKQLNPEIEYQYLSLKVPYEISEETTNQINPSITNLEFQRPERVKASARPTEIEFHEEVPNEKSSSQVQKYINESNLNSQYKKNIISSLDNILIMKYQIHNSKIPLNPSFMDVLCINCYECVKFGDMDFHSQKCVIGVDEFKENDYSEDYNTRIFKLHESLKAKKDEINQTNIPSLINFYNKLLQIIYEILLNNNSIEELDLSIEAINKMIKNDIDTITQNYKFYFLVFSQRISQLVYLKLKDMEKLLINQEEAKEEGNEDDMLDDDYNWNYIEEENDDQVKYMKMQLSDLQSQTEQAKKELSLWKKEAKMLESNLRKPNIKNNGERLSEIVSDVNSKCESIDIMTTFSGQVSELGDFEYNANEGEQMTEEEQKKYFLSLGLGVKFKYSDQIKDSVSIADIYEKAKEMHIEPPEYQNFLIQELGVKIAQ